ncbi:MAG: TonB-dependent receptor [Pedobacter sp.]|nr:TonB-dependent receptor [Chitinophagaceae bacterium]
MKKKQVIALSSWSKPFLSFFFLLFIISNSPVLAQTANKDIVVSGTVKDDKGNALVGVTIAENGTNNRVQTNDAGIFKIKVASEKSILSFSSTNFGTETVAISSKRVYSVVLKTVVAQIDEVIVVGYGTQKKVNNTGATATIKTKELVQSPVANISNSLVGRLPGLFATQSGGEPGNDGSKIRIRGVGTFSGNTDPLTLVDGIQVDNYNNIDPNEIESLTILKDASSTAVYGIRGANGVILITTKRGKAGPPKVSYTFNQGFNSFTNLRTSQTSGEYARGFNQGKLADTYVNGNTYTPQYTPLDIELYENGKDPIFHPNNNWFKLLFRDVSTQSQHNLNISGGQKKVKYFISGGYFTQQGLFQDLSFIAKDFDPNSTYKRYNIRSNFNFDVTDRFKILLDLSSQTEFRNGPNGNGNGTDGTGTARVIGDIARAAPTELGQVDGKVSNLYTPSNNPYAAILYQSNTGGVRRTYRNYLNGSLRFDYDLSYITPGLSTHGLVAIQTYNQQQKVTGKLLISYMVYPINGGPYNGGYANFVPNATETQFSFSASATYNRRITGEFGIDYKRKFGNHNVTALLVYNQQKTYDPSLAFLVPQAVQSYVGRATYDYKGRYLAEINAAYNGTENFAPGKRFGLFPGYSIGWVASNESFFPKKSIVSFLKIRGSYGEVGNDQIGGARFLYRPTSYGAFGDPQASSTSIYYFGNVGSTYAGIAGLREGATGNPNVTWERAVKQNIGLEINFFKDKLRFTGDLFDEKRSDILATPQSISAITGIVQPATNLGKMENKGYEFDVNFSDFIGKVGYRIGGNFSFARNKLIYQDEIPKQYAYQNRTGQRLGQNFLVIADGLYNTWDEVNDAKRPLYASSNNRIQPGDIKFRDANGDGIINDLDAVPTGYANLPEKTFGLSLSANYKGFDISVLFQGVGNVSLYYTSFQRSTGYGGAPPSGTAAYFNESWTAERYAAGLPIKFPRFSVTGSPNSLGSSFFLADASYLRLKNTEIGYTAKPSILKRIGISSMRIYANANNLVTWSKVYKGIDPENTSTGDTNTEPYPLVRTVNVGVNINF